MKIVEFSVLLRSVMSVLNMDWESVYMKINVYTSSKRRKTGYTQNLNSHLQQPFFGILLFVINVSLHNR